MAITRTDVELVAPELSGVPNDRMNKFIAVATTRLKNASCWGDLLEHAQALLVAHMLTMSNLAAGGGGGAVTSKTVGSVSVAFAAPQVSAGMATWNATGYGQQLLEIMRSIPKFRLPFTTGRYG